MVTYANGFVPASALAPLDGQPGCFLRADAAAAWNAGRAEVHRRTGIILSVRGWNRSYAEQVTFYLQRHTPWRSGLRKCCYWPGHGWYAFTGTAHAAPPGTSNHGWGLAVDVTDFGNVGNFNHPRRLKAFPILAQYGWTDTEGRGSIREPWHLVWNPSSAYAINNPIGGGGSVTIPAIPGKPGPIPEDDMPWNDKFDKDVRGSLQNITDTLRNFDRDARASLSDAHRKIDAQGQELNATKAQLADVQLRVASMHGNGFQPWRAGAPGGSLSFLDAKLAATAGEITTAILTALPQATVVDKEAVAATVRSSVSDALADAAKVLAEEGR